MSWFSRYYDRCMAGSENAGLGAWRNELFASLEDQEVLELGAGTGVNLAHYPAHLARLVQTEPDPDMLAILAARGHAQRRGRVEAAGADAQALPYANASFDAVVITLVLCSVPDPAKVLREAARVLRPGGRVLFIEHVAASDPKLRRIQGWIEPIWHRVAGGCRLTRDPRPLLVQAGLELESCTEDRLPRVPDFVSPAIRGVARRLAFVRA